MGGLQVGMIESRSVELARTYRDIVIPVCLHDAVLRLRSSKCTDEEQEIRKSRAEHHQPRNWPMAQAIMSSQSPPSGLTAIKSGHVTGDNFPYRSSQSLSLLTICSSSQSAMAMAFRARSAALMRRGRLHSFVGRSRGLATVTDNTQYVFSPGYCIGA
jgi:hypothetical protein